VNDPFLIDECLSLDLVAFANSRGHHATHVVFRTLQGTDDRALMPVIHAEGFVLVTSNARDFLRLYREEAVHPGLILILPWTRSSRCPT
jgi:predicted nuclease of predicted toxin-antitoxin system